MMHHYDLFTPDDVDRQIDEVERRRAGDPVDAEALVYLRIYYRLEATQGQETDDMPRAGQRRPLRRSRSPASSAVPPTSSPRPVV